MRPRGLTRKSKRGGRHTLRQRGGAYPPIYIVYFAYLDVGTDEWATSRAKKLVSHQMQELKDIGLADAAKEIHLVFNAPENNAFNDGSAMILDMAENDMRSILPDMIFHGHRGNAYEYEGIKRVWDIAKRIPSAEKHKSLVLYFHSKGMSNGDKHANVRTPSKELSDIVIKPWKDIVARFESDEKINKAGYAASDTGFMWINFWWARASYLIHCPRPIITQERHHYEGWLGYRKTSSSNNYRRGQITGIRKDASDCLSLCKVGPKGRLGVVVHPAEEVCVLETGSKA